MGEPFKGRVRSCMCLFGGWVRGGGEKKSGYGLRGPMSRMERTQRDALAYTITLHKRCEGAGGNTPMYERETSSRGVSIFERYE